MVTFSLLWLLSRNKSRDQQKGEEESKSRCIALNVKRRRAYISNRLAEEHLEMVAYGTDGDTREMKCELESSAVGITLKELSTTLSKESEEFLFFQEMLWFICMRY